MPNEIEDYQADHLMLLLGSNPLPNFVAAKLLLQGGNFRKKPLSIDVGILLLIPTKLGL